MIDRDKVLSVLHKRFPEASAQQVAWAANAIVGLTDERDLIARNATEIECSASAAGRQSCDSAGGIPDGPEFRRFAARTVDIRW